jgi:transposase
VALVGSIGADAKKKARRASEADPVARAEFAAKQESWPTSRLVFVDDFAINTVMTRTHARAPRGERAVVLDPCNYGQSVSVISALTLRGIVAPMPIEGAVNSEVFALYVEQLLAPVLRGGDIVCLDNVKFHYSARAVSLIEAAGARVEYLPAYSPDFDPSEECISKLKTILRTLKARTHHTLGTALKYALAQVTPADIRGWFKHCGYTYSLN